ncbi:heavy-metal-associated domain-containing protein [Gordonia iterans]
MKAGTRLVLYGLGLVVAFAAAFGIARAVVPQTTVDSWNERAAEHGAHDDAAHDEGTDSHDGHAADGLSLESGGFMLSTVEAPTTLGADGRLSFQILDRGGVPVTDYAVEHGKELHLIVVRTDGTQFRHVHPELDRNSGTWSLPWRWEAAGAYRVYADFVPAGDGASGITLSQLVEVGGGAFEPVPARPVRTAEVDGFTVTVDGDLVAGSAQTLTLTVARDGRPVTELQPYLGAYGHLVALRQGDLAYLHVHADGAEPAEGQTAGPDLKFAAAAPTEGRYLLYLDFQVDGAVHTAQFVLDAHGAHEHDHEK